MGGGGGGSTSWRRVDIWVVKEIMCIVAGGLVVHMSAERSTGSVCVCVCVCVCVRARACVRACVRA